MVKSDVGLGITPTELDAALKELDKKQESRLYTVEGRLSGRIDKLAEDVGTLKEDMRGLKADVGDLKESVCRIEVILNGKGGSHAQGT